MIKVVGIRFKKAGKIYYFDPVDIDVKKGDNVIVETIRGLEFGNIVVGPKNILEEDLVSPLKPIIRFATDEDINIHKENKVMAKEAYDVCEEKVKLHKLDMYLIDSEYTFDRNKLIFYFTAEGRIDFRELVKDLAAIFKTRIELRQIGVRDEAKSMGGLGCCGRSLCCASWLGDFQPVSIKMAKDQNLSLNPSKISGVCGRLFCCLKYEHETYVKILKRMPTINSIVLTPYGEGRVIDTNTLLESAKVIVDELDDIKICSIHEIKIIEMGKKSKYINTSQMVDKSEFEELKKLEEEDKKELGVSKPKKKYKKDRNQSNNRNKKDKENTEKSKDSNKDKKYDKKPYVKQDKKQGGKFEKKQDKNQRSNKNKKDKYKKEDKNKDKEINKENK